MGGAEQQFCLRWNNHQSTLISVFETLLESETLVDVTLAAEGRFLKAHKVVLCACSPFFQDLLSSHLEKYPIIVLKDVSFQELKALIDYMYRGEVNVSQEQLAALIKTAESLKIKGLADGGTDKHKRPLPTVSSPATSAASPVPPSLSIPPPTAATPGTADATSHHHVRHSPVNSIRESSASPIFTKRRKRSRRRSGNSLEAAGSVESSCSEPPPPPGGGGGSVGDIVAATAQSRDQDNQAAEKERVIRALGLVPPSALLLEPKSEEIEEDEDESVDLMMDEEPNVDTKETAGRPGPSHEGLPASASGSLCSPTCSTNTSTNTSSMSRLAAAASGDSLDALYTMLDRTGFPPWHVTPERGGGSSTPGEDLSISVAGGDSGSGGLENRDYDGEETDDWNDDEGDRTQLQHGNNNPFYAHGITWIRSSNLNLSSSTFDGDSGGGGGGGGEGLIMNNAIINNNNPIQHNSGPYFCSRCGRSYKRKSSLSNHMRWECGKEPQFTCPYCPQKSKQKMHIIRHVNRRHREVHQIAKIPLYIAPDSMLREAYPPSYH